MKERKKQALIILAIATPMLAYGAFTFEIGGAASTAEAITKSIVTTLGLAGTVAGLLMFFTKNSLGMVETKPKPDLSPEELINLNEAWDTAEKWMEEEPNDSWREDTVWEKEEPVQEEEPKLKMPS